MNSCPRWAPARPASLVESRAPARREVRRSRWESHDGPSGGRGNKSGARQELLGMVLCCVSGRHGTVPQVEDSASDKATQVASITAQADCNDRRTEPIVLSRDESGSFLAWGLVSGTAVDSVEGSGAGRVVVDAFGDDSVAGSISSWREKQCLYVGRPKEREFFLKNTSQLGRSDAGRVFVRKNGGFMLEASIAHPERGEERCTCVASIQFECGVWDGTTGCVVSKEGSDLENVVVYYTADVVRRPYGWEHWAA